MVLYLLFLLVPVLPLHALDFRQVQENTEAICMHTFKSIYYTLSWVG